MVIKRIVPVYILCIVTHTWSHTIICIVQVAITLSLRILVYATRQANAAFDDVKNTKRIKYRNYIYLWYIPIVHVWYWIIKFTTRMFYKPINVDVSDILCLWRTKSKRKKLHLNWWHYGELLDASVTEIDARKISKKF